MKATSLSSDSNSVYTHLHTTHTLPCFSSPDIFLVLLGTVGTDICGQIGLDDVCTLTHNTTNHYYTTMKSILVSRVVHDDLDIWVGHDDTMVYPPECDL